MKNYLMAFILIGGLSAQSDMPSGKSFGIMLMGGGRYDD